MIDFQLVTLNLRRHYKPLTHVAKEVGCSRECLQDLSTGRTKQPVPMVYIKLLNLHYDKVPHLHKISVIGKP